MQGSAYSLLVETAALFVCWVGLAAWQSGPGASGRREALAVCALLWFFLIGTVLEERSVVGRLTGDTLRLFAVCTLPAFWLGLAGFVARLDLFWRVRLLPWLLALPGLTVWLLLYAGPWAELVRSSEGALEVRGPLYQAYAVYACLLVLVASGLFLHGWKHAKQLAQRRRRAGLALSGLLALVLHFLWEANLLPQVGGDLSPVAMVVAMFVLRGAFVSGGLFESVPVSQRDLLNSLSVGLVIANPAGLVLQINPAALERLGLVEAEEALGRDLDAVFNGLVRNQQVEIRPIRGGDETLGLCAVITGRSAPWPKQGASGRTAA